MNPRVLVLSLILLPLALAITAAQPRRITTDKEPSYLFADSANNRIHVLTAGYDVNFDGIFEADSGDVLPRWFVIDANTETVVDSATFDSYFSSFPLRVGVNLQDRLLYVSQMGRIRAYNIDTRKLARDTVALGFFSGVSFDPIQKRLAVTERPGFTDPGWLMLLDSAGRDTLARVMVGVSPNMTVSTPSAIGGLTDYYTLSEGVFGMPNSMLSYAQAQQGVYSRMNGKDLGGGGTFIVSRGNLACFALGGGHRVHVVDSRTHKDLPYSPLVLGPAGQNGPRALDFQGDSILLIGLYSNQLMRMRLSDGLVLDTIPMRGKVESIAVHDSLAYVAIRNPAAGGIDSMVMVVNLNGGRVVDSLRAGQQPLVVFITKNGDIHVISVGAGDSAHTWTVFDPVTRQAKASHIFTGLLDTPFRAVYDSTSDTVYAVVSSTLKAFSAAGAGLDSRTVYTPANAYGKLVAVSDGGPEYLLLIESTVSGAGNEYVHVIDKKGSLLARFKTSVRPIMAARVTPSHNGAIALYVLDRGTTSAQHSELDVYEFQPNILGADTLGKGANHMSIVMGFAGVTMNGNNSFLTVDLTAWSVNKRVSTGTTGFDGPREAVILDNDRVVVTTYAGDVRVLKPTGEHATYPIGGKGEGLVAMGSKVFVASAFAPTYAPDSAVVVFDNASLVASVEREQTVAAAVELEQNYPNPASAGTSIRFAVARPAQVTLALYSASGELVENAIDRPMESGSYVISLNVNTLPSGTYLYTLRCDGKVLTRTMKVVR